MAWNRLIENIESQIKLNGVGSITGQVLQDVLLDMIAELSSAGSAFGGMVTPEGTYNFNEESKFFVVVKEDGDYSNIGYEGELKKLTVLNWNPDTSAWVADTTIADEIVEINNHLGELDEKVEQAIYNLAGKKYGAFPSETDLPEGNEVGYAFVGEHDPFALYLCDGKGNWENTGVFITGMVGPEGPTGPTGPTNTLSIGTVETLETGEPAEAEITGDAPNQTLNLKLPKGGKGDKGDKGDAGHNPNLGTYLISNYSTDAPTTNILDGDYIVVVDNTVTPETSEIYKWNGSAWVTTGRDANDATFATNELVGNVSIINDLITGGEHDVLSAEQGKIVGNALFNDKNLSMMWQQGTLNSGIYQPTGGVSSERILAVIPSENPITITVANGYFVTIHSYSDIYTNVTQIIDADSWLGVIQTWRDGTFTIAQPSGGKTFVVIVKKGSDGNTVILPSEGDTAVTSVTTKTDLKTRISFLEDAVFGYGSTNQQPISVTWQQGTLNSGIYQPTGGVSSERILAVINASEITLDAANGYYFTVHSYTDVYTDATQIINANSWLGNQVIGWQNGQVTVAQPSGGKTFVVIVKKGSDGNTVILPSEGDTAIPSINGYIYISGLVEKVNSIVEDTGNYVYGEDLLKRKVNVENIGSLKYLQAFCVYDGKYYSTNGSNIAEQDSSFNVLRDVTIDVGHGNSLQLGLGAYAWANGWNDQKIYKVDLATLAVINTITLPTTGYTMGAVDELNGLIYIFQRDTRPNIEENYNFIIYDYINQEIISTRVIESFAAMQSVDYYQGKILMLWGLSTNVAPSGMRIYNTAGDVLSFFNLAVFRTTEPEGIMFERESKIILVSDVNKAIYRVTQTV